MRLLQLISEKKVSKEEVMKEVTEILDEMSHSLTLKAVRGLAFFLIKVFKALFRRVYVNEDGVQMVKKVNNLVEF
jgi:glycerone phosphate O-acyltransferase